MRAMVARTVSVVLVGAGVLLATAAVAIAVHPVRGARYTGKAIATRKYYGLTFSGPVSFKVSRNGKRVENLQVPIPVHCQYGGVNPPKPASAPITRRGTFNKTLKFYGANRKYAGKIIVTGTFHAKRKESGKLRSSWARSFAFNSFASCDTTWTYSTSG